MFEIETDHWTLTAHGGPALTVSLACQGPHVNAIFVPFGTLFLIPRLPLRKGDSRGGNATPDKQISRLGLAEIRPLEAIRLKIKQKFNEN